MAAILAGGRLTPKEKSRVTLSVRSPLVNSLLAGLSIEGRELNELHAFSNRLVSDRNKWDIERHHGGLFGYGRRFSRADAERAWMAVLTSSNGSADHE